MSIRVGETIISSTGGASNLDSVYCTAPQDVAPVVGNYLQFTKKTGTMTVSNGRVVVKPGQRVQIIVTLTADNGSLKHQATEWQVKDYTNNVDIAPVAFLMSESDMRYERAPVVTCQYENTTNANAEIGVVCTAVYTSGGTGGHMTVTEIGKAISIGSSDIYKMFTTSGKTAPTIYNSRASNLVGGYEISNGYCYYNMSFTLPSTLSASYYDGGASIFLDMPKPATQNSGIGTVVNTSNDIIIGCGCTILIDNNTGKLLLTFLRDVTANSTAMIQGMYKLA